MIEYQQTKKTDTGEFIISHSDLCTLDPQLGGHPKLFYKSLTDTEEKFKKPSFEKGDLLHLWMEKKAAFVVSEQEKPTDKPAALAEKFFELYIKEGWKADPVFLEVRSHNTTIDVSDHIMYKELAKIILRKELSEEEFATFVAALRFSRKQTNYNKNLKEGTFIEHVKQVVPYIEFLKEASGKIILTGSMRDTLNNCVDSLREHPFAAKLIWGMEGECEKEYFWQKKIGDYTMNRKAKLDKVIVDEFNKILIIPDYKTTSYPVSNFASPEGSYNKYALGRQLTSYANAYFENNKECHSGNWRIYLYNIVVQTTDPYPVMVYRTSEQSAFDLHQSLKELEHRAAYHIVNHVWSLTMEESQSKDNEFIII